MSMASREKSRTVGKDGTKAAQLLFRNLKLEVTGESNDMERTQWAVGNRKTMLKDDFWMECRLQAINTRTVFKVKGVDKVL